MGQEILDFIEKRLKAKKIEAYDILIKTKKNHENIFLKDSVDSFREVQSMEYMIRIYNQKEEPGMGVIHSSELKEERLDKIIDQCMTLSKINKTTKYEFPDKGLYNDIKTTESKIIKDPTSVLDDLSEELNSCIKDEKNVVPTFGRLGVIIRENYLRNYKGINLSDESTYLFLEFAIKAEEGKNLAEFWDVNLYKQIAHLDIQNRMKHWAKLAVDTLKAKQPRSKQDATIVFPPKILMHAINPVIGYHATGQAHFEKVSSFEIDKEVSSPNLTIKDNGLLEGCLSTFPWDGEGTPTRSTILIQDGIFKNRIYDQRYAILENTKSTGNGARTMDGNVVNNITNLEILEGDLTYEELISNIKEGLYVEKFSWLNPDRLSGSFGTEIRNAYTIKNGELTEPIKGGNVSGNVLTMIKRCLNITKERKFMQNCLYPFMSFDGLIISS
ncbi:MAG: TldD/PmbA family protein [Candidatus Lokiarchaeota archaeon]|nr:TldD/PmbA family protein [Candidatus Lokiarchaeota archaeon]